MEDYLMIIVVVLIRLICKSRRHSQTWTWGDGLFSFLSINVFPSRLTIATSVLAVSLPSRYRWVIDVLYIWDLNKNISNAARILPSTAFVLEPRSISSGHITKTNFGYMAVYGNPKISTQDGLSSLEWKRICSAHYNIHVQDIYIDMSHVLIP